MDGIWTEPRMVMNRKKAAIGFALSIGMMMLCWFALAPGRTEAG